MARCNYPIPISKDGRATTSCTLELGHEGLHGAQLPIATEWFDYTKDGTLVANPQRIHTPQPKGETK